ncbi:MAG: site-specific DNA-methyltransferase, partial [Deltaproteobacteria bacterium]|nr:site-specific DNA-methyltransferase [Deltaproteobacteria bacterium]
MSKELDRKKISNEVICLGLTFQSDLERREYFSLELKEKLRDPLFRKTLGFPIGSDTDILNLSDPPYFTLCPNPWIANFIALWESQKPPTPHNYKYHREPYNYSVSEGKAEPIYNAHSYHTKVPYKAIMRYLLHYTLPGDIIFDGFAGSGMTGVAAQMCGDREVVVSLGFQVTPDGIILKEEVSPQGDKIFKPFSRLGPRRAILNDLAPAATLIAANFNSQREITFFANEAENILDEVKNECLWLYETWHGDISGTINFVVWSEVNICDNCGREFVFSKVSYDKNTQKIRKNVTCPHCKTQLSKPKLKSVREEKYDSILQKNRFLPKRVPVLINYSIDGKKYEKSPDEKDLALFRKIEGLEIPAEVPATLLPDMQMTRIGRMRGSGVTHTHHFFLPRTAYILGLLWKKVKNRKPSKERDLLFFWLDSQLINLSLRNRYRPGVSFPYNPLTGIFYVPSMVSEPNVFKAYANKLKNIVKAFENLPQGFQNLVQTSATNAPTLPSASQDYIFTDPPFGGNIYYSDLNFFTESWYRIFTNPETEAIIDKVKKKTLTDYQSLLRGCFQEYYRVLKPGRFLTLVFSNSQAAVWNAIQDILREVGFVIKNVAALDKKQRSFQSVISLTAVKQDLVITLYKPEDEEVVQDVFSPDDTQQEGLWEFIEKLLRDLPLGFTNKALFKFIPER